MIFFLLDRKCNLIKSRTVVLLSLGHKVSIDGKKFSAYIETDLPICLSNFVYLSILNVKGMWWACIRTNFMIAVAQKTCFYQKITQKIHWNVARQSYNFFSSFFLIAFYVGVLTKGYHYDTYFWSTWPGASNCMDRRVPNAVVGA